MKFSQRTDWPTIPNPLTQLIEEKKKAGVPLIDLTQSNPTQCDFSFLNEDWLKPLTTIKNLSYEPDARGLLEAREAVCAYYAEKKVQVTPEQIFLTASTSEAYAFIFRLLCDPRDLVVVPRPSYPLFDYLAALSDVEPIRYFLTYDRTWGISTDSFEIPFIERPKALILVNPNNPTGNFLKSEELRSINRLCAKSETAIISDEVFLDFVFDAGKTKPLSLAGNREVLTFTLSGLSKILGLPQMKLSWIVVSGPPEPREKAIERLEIIADTALSVNTPAQHAAAEWLRSRKSVQREILERLRLNFKTLEEKLADKKGIEVLTSEGGWSAILKLDARKTDEELALFLLQNQNLVTHPGYFFDFGEGEFLVLSLLVPPKVLGEGVSRLLAETQRRAY